MKKILLIVLIALGTQSSYGQNIVKLGDNSYQARIEPGHFRVQKMNNGLQDDQADVRSWAACVAMVLDYENAAVSQDQLLSFAFPTTDDYASGPAGLMVAMNNIKPTIFGQQAHVYCENVSVNEDALFDELSNDRPLIAGLHNINNEGTGVVIMAISYSIKRDANGEQTGITPTAVTVGNPWPAESAIKTITWADFMKNVNALYTLKASIGKSK